MPLLWYTKAYNAALIIAQERGCDNFIRRCSQSYNVLPAKGDASIPTTRPHLSRPYAARVCGLSVLEVWRPVMPAAYQGRLLFLAWPTIEYRLCHSGWSPR